MRRISATLGPLSKRRPLAAVCLLVACVAAAAGARAALRASPAAHARAEQADAGVQVLLLTLGPTSFEPSEVTLPKGKYLIVVHNRTGLEGFALRLERDGGVKLHEARVPARKLEWGGQFDMTPGEYVLSEADHPEWACRVNVNAN
jgi:uncharacterized cupredoxin-like copper-binding protein